MEEAIISILKDTPWIAFMVYLIHKTVPLFQQTISILGRVLHVLEEVEGFFGIECEIPLEKKGKEEVNHE